MIKMSQKVNEKQKASERHSLYIASATAKRFSSTSDYPSQHITIKKTYGISVIL